MHRILLIEDDVSLRMVIKDCLEKYDYEVCIPDNLRELELYFNECMPSIVLLDINLPYYDGFYLCRAFRKSSSVPIIIISARNGEMDQVMGIELGADDYLTKPFSLQILLVKVKAALRRAYGDYSDKMDIASRKSLYVEEKTFRLHYKEQSVELTKTEFRLVNKLFEKENVVVSREELLEEMWDDSYIAGDNALTVNITRIKNKFLELGIRDIVKTKRGVGYILDTSILKGDTDEEAIGC